MGIISAASFRTVGNAAATQNLFSIRNSGNKIVTIRRLVMQMDVTAVLVSVMPLIKACRISDAPTGGTALTKVRWGGAVSDDSVTVLGATASDGGSLTAITATPTATMWEQFGFRLHTAVGQVLTIDNNMICGDYPVELGIGEGVLVHILAPGAASNPVTNHYIVQCVWHESE